MMLNSLPAADAAHAGGAVSKDRVARTSSSVASNVNIADRRFLHMSGNKPLAGQRLAFVISLLGRGGSERQAILTARYLRDVAGADVVVWGLSDPGPAVDECERYAIPVRSFPLPWSGSRWDRIAAMLRFAKALRADRPDVILPYCARPNVTCGLTWRLTGAKACFWNQRAAGYPTAGTRWERWAVKNCSAVLSNAEVQADRLARDTGFDRARIEIVPNGVELPPAEATRGEWRNRLGLNADDYLACMVANFYGPKDHLTLLRAWRLVVDGFTSDARRAVLVCAGNADRAQREKALAFDLSLTGHVRFLGSVTDIAGLLGACDVGVHSSKSEGTPNAVLECMAKGLPVVATDIPGIRQAVGPQNLPWLCAPDDYTGFAELVLQLAHSPRLRECVGKANMERISNKFAIQTLGQRMIQLLTRHLAPPN